MISISSSSSVSYPLRGVRGVSRRVTAAGEGVLSRLERVGMTGMSLALARVRRSETRWARLAWTWGLHEGWRRGAP